NLLEDPALTSELRLDLEAGSKTVEIRSAIAESGDRHAIFLVDISERVALGRQLQSSRLPSRKLLYQLNVAATTMSGYAELIDLMLDEEPIVSGERLNVIRRYHREVRDNLDTMLRLLKIEREGGRRPDSPAIPIRRKQVVVVDDEPAIAEFISELMKGMKFRVVTFTDAAEALSFLSAESDGVDLVITDHVPDGPGDLDFTRSVLALPAAFPVVICSELEGEFVDAPRAYVCHKPIDITELSRIVADLIPE
ncbi:MAG TPA: response regulator, partial [Pseudomonadales bacterium]|nr:response regulator [Pseudomonadales bacterium]